MRGGIYATVGSDQSELKISKFRKQIIFPKLLPKTNQAHYPGRLLPQG